MPKMRGLGKGLDALFGTTPIMEELQIGKNDVLQNLKITEVEPNRDQPRQNFDQEALEELAESIKNVGLIQPIVVCKKEGYYGIIAGERRWRASKIAGLTEIPVIIREDDAKKNKEISLIENVQREDLNPYEKAIGIKALMTDFGLTFEDVSKELGKSASALANTVRILNLSPKVLDIVKQGKLNEGYCFALLSIQDPDEQYKFARRILDKGITTVQAQKEAQFKKKNPGIDEKYGAIYRDIENRFQGFFGTKVRVDAGRRKGKIIIEYNNNDDLTRILDLIK